VERDNQLRSDRHQARVIAARPVVVVPLPSLTACLFTPVRPPAVVAASAALSSSLTESPPTSTASAGGMD